MVARGGQGLRVQRRLTSRISLMRWEVEGRLERMAEGRRCDRGASGWGALGGGLLSGIVEGEALTARATWRLRLQVLGCRGAGRVKGDFAISW